ncbi:hypothetical protein MMC09_004931 [Bachmanniomyces sp. S44760]|nr:hypothetical protein [Bachmanniomyces sp. S44760]
MPSSRRESSHKRSSPRGSIHSFVGSVKNRLDDANDEFHEIVESREPRTRDRTRSTTSTARPHRRESSSRAGTEKSSHSKRPSARASSSKVSSYRSDITEENLAKLVSSHKISNGDAHLLSTSDTSDAPTEYSRAPSFNSSRRAPKPAPSHRSSTTRRPPPPSETPPSVARSHRTTDTRHHPSSEAPHSVAPSRQSSRSHRPEMSLIPARRATSVREPPASEARSSRSLSTIRGPPASNHPPPPPSSHRPRTTHDNTEQNQLIPAKSDQTNHSNNNNNGRTGSTTSRLLPDTSLTSHGSPTRGIDLSSLGLPSIQEMQPGQWINIRGQPKPLPGGGTLPADSFSAHVYEDVNPFTGQAEKRTRIRSYDSRYESTPGGGSRFSGNEHEEDY